MTPGVAVRRTALDALVRIEEEGAYANLVLDPVLKSSGLDQRDLRDLRRRRSTEPAIPEPAPATCRPSRVGGHAGHG